MRIFVCNVAHKGLRNNKRFRADRLASQYTDFHSTHTFLVADKALFNLHICTYRNVYAIEYNIYTLMFFYLFQVSCLLKQNR